jgi:hypothetical protein
MTPPQLTWPDIQKQFPNEWVAVASGEVVTHHPDKTTFYETLATLPITVRDLELRYTGPLIPEEDAPLLWQISNTHSTNTSR